MPFADYKDHDDCVSKNKDKADPDAYCATIERKVKEGKKVIELEQITERTFIVKSAGVIEPGVILVDQNGNATEFIG